MFHRQVFFKSYDVTTALGIVGEEDLRDKQIINNGQSKLINY